MAVDPRGLMPDQPAAPVPEVRVHVHWLSRGGLRALARWRRRPDPDLGSALDAVDLSGVDGGDSIGGFLLGILVAIAAVVVAGLLGLLLWFVVIPLLLGLLDAVVLVVLLLASVPLRVLLGRPWLVTVQRGDAVLARRSVQGWRRARAVRDNTAAALARGIDPADALSEASEQAPVRG